MKFRIWTALLGFLLPLQLVSAQQPEPAVVLIHGEITTPILVWAPDTPSAITGPTSDPDGSYSLSWGSLSGASTYELERALNGGAWAQIQATSATTRNEVSLPVGDYSYRVRACNFVGCSEYTDVHIVSVVPAGVPATPGAISAVSPDYDGTVDLSWSAVSGATTYKINRRESGGVWTSTAAFATTSWSETVSSGSYDYQVRACNANGCSGWSAVKTVEVLLPPTMGAISGPTISVTGTFSLNWSTVPTATTYRLERRVQGGAWPGSPLQDSAATSWSETSLANGRYEYRVSACNLAGCGTPSPIHDVEVQTQVHTIATPPAAATYNDPGALQSSDEIGTTAGEFRVNESGAATYSIPILTAEGTAGNAPRISLNYSSGVGIGIAGMGWSVGGLSAITRCKQTYDQDRTVLPISWSSTDRFCLDGQRLLLEDELQTYGAVDTVYRTEIDTGARVFIRGSVSGEPNYFEVQRKNGSTSYYGLSPNDLSNTSAKYGGVAGETFIWAIREYRDRVGNPIWFDYENDADGQRIGTIYWAFGSNTGPVTGYGARLIFDYADRSDKRTGYVAGVELSSNKRLSAIRSYNVVGSEALIRQYNLAYNEGITVSDKLSRLTSIQECVGVVCLPKTTFDWRVPAASSSMDQLSTFSMAESNDLSDFTLADINGDGLMDLVWIEGAAASGVLNFAISNGTSYTQTSFNGGGLEYSLPGGGEKLTAIDYNLDGRQDIVYWSETATEWRVIISVPQTDGSWRLNNTYIVTPIDHDEVTFVDVDSNGTTDAVWTAGTGVGPGQLYLSRLEKNPLVTLPSSPTAYHFATPEAIGVPSAATTGLIATVAADFNGDGSVGVVMGYNQPVDCEFAENPPFCNNPKYTYLLNIDAVNGSTPSYSAYANLNTVGPTTSTEHVRTWGVTPTDVNADGLSDLFYPVFEDPWTDIGQYHLAINNGDGTFDVSEFYEPTIDHITVSRPQFVDWNSDGFPDLMWKSTAGSGTVYVRYWDPQFNQLGSRQTATTANNQTTESVYFPDINGDGVPDKMEIDVSTGAGVVTTYSRRSAGTPVNVAVNRIEKITNGLGAETAITYEPLSYSDHYERMQVLTSPTAPGGGDVYCIETGPSETTCVNRAVAQGNADAFYTTINGDWDIPGSPAALEKTSPVLEVSGPMYVVTDVVGSTPSGSVGSPGSVSTTATSSLSYYYSAAKAQAAGRGFLGFEQLKTIDNIDGVETTTQYRQDWPFTGFPIGTVVARGAPHEYVIGGGSAEWSVLGWTQLQRDTVVTDGTASLGPIYVEQTEKRENVYDLAGNGTTAGALLGSTTTTVGHDTEANVKNVTVVVRDEVTAQIVQTVTTTNTYQLAPFTRWQGRLSQTVVVSDRAAATGTETRTTDFNHYESGPHFGLQRQEIVEPNDPVLELTTTHYYDAHGNRVRSTESDGTTTRCSAPTATSVYDSSGRYIDTTYDCLDQMRSVVESRNAFGDPLIAATVLDATNTTSRLRTRIFYGSLGREYFRWSDDGSARTTYFSDGAGTCPAGTSYATTSTDAGGVEEQICYDVLARETRSLSRGFDGAWDAQDTIYDSKGRTIHKSEPFDLSGGASYWTSMQYDLFDRVTRTTRPDGSWTDAGYSGFVTTTTASFESQTRTEEYTVLGDLKQVTDDLSGVSSFSYDNLGNLATSTDAAGNITTTVYNKLGRRTSMRTPHSDPTKGLWVYEFNHFGELKKQTSANGHTSEMTYDGLGRIKTRIDKYSGGSTESNTTWTYDTSPNGLGKLDVVNEAQAGYAKAVLYDSLGRSDETVINFGGGAYYEKTTYDQYGRVFQYFDASGDGTFGDNGIETRYSTYGRVAAVVDAGYVGGVTRMTYREVLTMNARGQVVTERLGVETGGGYAIERTYGYYANTGRMRDIESKDDTGAWVQDLYYDWNVVGSLTTRQDTYHGLGGPNTLTENFGYDDLNRLTSHGEIGQAALTVTYDAIGNIKTKTGVTGTYTYGAGASPYAVTGINGNIYTYDENGNNLSGGGRTLTYSTFDKPVNITKGSSVVDFAYDVDRARLSRVDTVAGQVTTTRYVGDVEIIDRPDGTRERKRYIAGVAIETRTYNGSGDEIDRETLYTLKDHLGSLDVIVDRYGGIEQKLSFGPWGQRRNASNWQEVDGSNVLIDNMTSFNAERTTRGFTGHEMVDSVGIVHMNGRIYDPVLGRFLQADNYVQAPENSQSHNRYTYVWNNPLNATDPSGEIVFTLAGIVTIIGADISSKLAIFAIMSVAGTLDALVFTDANLAEALLSGLVSGVSSSSFGPDGTLSIPLKADFTGLMSGEPPRVRISSQSVNGGLATNLQSGQYGHNFIIEGNPYWGGAFYIIDNVTFGLWEYTTIDKLRKRPEFYEDIEAFEEAIGWQGKLAGELVGIRKEVVSSGIGIIQDALKKVTLPKGGAWKPPTEWAEHDHDLVKDRLRKEQAGFESGRHDQYPAAMRDELRRLADEADARGDLPEYGERMREIADTYAKRAREAHRGGRSGRR